MFNLEEIKKDYLQYYDKMVDKTLDNQDRVNWTRNLMHLDKWISY